MALPSTESLDISTRGGPALFIYDLTDRPDVNTGSLDIASRGCPALYIYDVTISVGGTNMKINIGDAWKDVDSIQVNIGDAWKPVTKVQINIGDAWKTVFE
jgi:hypothetical protein